MAAPVPTHRDHVQHVARFNPSAIRQGVREVEGFNAKLAVIITGAVGTMACAYLFACIALVSLPAAVNSGSTIILVAWVAQTFLQLVLLSIIMVGQRVQSHVSDERAEREAANVERLLSLMDAHTAGGIGDVLGAVTALGQKVDVVDTRLAKSPPGKEYARAGVIPPKDESPPVDPNRSTPGRADRRGGAR